MRMRAAEAMAERRELMPRLSALSSSQVSHAMGACSLQVSRHTCWLVSCCGHDRVQSLCGAAAGIGGVDFVGLL